MRKWTQLTAEQNALYQKPLTRVANAGTASYNFLVLSINDTPALNAAIALGKNLRCVTVRWSLTWQCAYGRWS